MNLTSLLFQNIHLVRKWLPTLEKKLEALSEGADSNFRVFMSAEPASSAAGHIIPQVSSNIHVIGYLPYFHKEIRVDIFDHWLQFALEHK